MEFSFLSEFGSEPLLHKETHGHCTTSNNIYYHLINWKSPVAWIEKVDGSVENRPGDVGSLDEEGDVEQEASPSGEVEAVGLLLRKQELANYAMK